MKTTDGSTNRRTCSCFGCSPQKTIQLERKVQQLEERLANEAIARDKILEENRWQIQEDEQKASELQREQLREELKKEMLSIITQQREEILHPQPHVILFLGVQ
jgi:hypothetical protein